MKTRVVAWLVIFRADYRHRLTPIATGAWMGGLIGFLLDGLRGGLRLSVSRSGTGYGRNLSPIKHLEGSKLRRNRKPRAHPTGFRAVRL